VDVDVHIGKAFGPNGEIFNTYLVIVAQEIFILTPTWDHVTKHERNIIWEDILVSNCVHFKNFMKYNMFYYIYIYIYI